MLLFQSGAPTAFLIFNEYALLIGFNEFIISFFFFGKNLFSAIIEFHVSKYANDEPYEMIHRTECERGSGMEAKRKDIMNV